jgi:osmotically-inducible protein OsmY
MTRNDERIKRDVAAQLSRNSRVDSGAVKVEVSDGEVTLSGTLPSLSVCMAAVELIEKVAGVRSVKNNLKVKIVKPA